MSSEDLEAINRRVYEHEYPPIAIERDKDPKDYYNQMVDLKLGMVREYSFSGSILDIGCGNGDFLFELNGSYRLGKGIDFTDNAISAANAKKDRLGLKNVDFIKGNAQELPFKDEEFDLVYSYAALVYVNRLDLAIREAARVLKRGGTAILDLGNGVSLNTFVCNAYPDIAKQNSVSVSMMKRYLRDSGLVIRQCRAFQILPYWGNRPGWLKPLLNHRWKSLAQMSVGGKMIDEWISSFFLFKPFSYRHIFVCQKG